jgi:dolichol-phosphate mannosyltransferase
VGFYVPAVSTYGPPSPPGPPGRVELSVVIPVYDERESLAPLLEEIAAALRGTPYEVVAVDDGSTDGSLAELKRLRAAHPGLRVVAFERNAGQTAALTAGFRVARGAVIVTLDADLQNDPADIPALVAELWAGGATAVAGYREARQDTAWKRLQSRIANTVRNWLNGERIRDTGCSLRALRAEAVRDLPLFNGMHRFLPTLIRMRGGRVAELPVRHRPRRYGRTKYGMRNRAWRALVDTLAVRWMQRRALRYRVTEEWP